MSETHFVVVVDDVEIVVFVVVDHQRINLNRLRQCFDVVVVVVVVDYGVE
jgi:hypothetical protein